jgi:hypothetical protein
MSAPAVYTVRRCLLIYGGLLNLYVDDVICSSGVDDPAYSCSCRVGSRVCLLPTVLSSSSRRERYARAFLFQSGSLRPMQAKLNGTAGCNFGRVLASRALQVHLRAGAREPNAARRIGKQQHRRRGSNFSARANEPGAGSWHGKPTRQHGIISRRRPGV